MIQQSGFNSIIKTALEYNPKDRKMCTFSKSYLEETIPEQFRIWLQDQAKVSIYVKSYAHIGVDFKASWTKKLNELCEKGS